MASTGSSICRAGAGDIWIPVLCTALGGWPLFVAGLGAWGDNTKLGEMGLSGAPISHLQTSLLHRGGVSFLVCCSWLCCASSLHSPMGWHTPFPC